MSRSILFRASLLIGSLTLAGCWEAPPMETEQIGFDGVAMQVTSNPDLTEPLKRASVLPEPLPAVAQSEGGPKAEDVYQNVQVLGDLSVQEFTRTMASITAWVSPDQGCAYCHVGNNFALDTIYTKVVSRRMMQLTMQTNTEWYDHVGETGVTCYTCHRGQPVPEHIWFDQPPANRTGGMAANSYQQNHANETVAYTSMARDIFDRYLDGEQEKIRVIAQTALPIRNVTQTQSTQATENTYSLMMHMSDSLGVNCTYCHNSRNFSDWEQSPPARVTAWHALQMVPSLNANFLSPLQPVYPDIRLGQLGDAPKVNCATCHQGVAKPLYGQSMLDDYPVWRGEGLGGDLPYVEPYDPMVPMEQQPETDGEAAAAATIPYRHGAGPADDESASLDPALLETPTGKPVR